MLVRSRPLQEKAKPCRGQPPISHTRQAEETLSVLHGLSPHARFIVRGFIVPWCGKSEVNLSGDKEEGKAASSPHSSLL